MGTSTATSSPHGPHPEQAPYPPWLEGARVAPSAHNTQPWRFAPLADGRIAVRWEPARTLPVGDPTYRDLYLGLGAAVESARLRAAEAGVSLGFTPAPDTAERLGGYLAPDYGAIDQEDLRLAGLLESRHTARVPHLARAIPAGVIVALQAEARRFGCALHVATTHRTIERLATLARQATAAQFADPEVHAELWQWLRLEPRDPAYRRDGLNAECLNLHGPILRLARLTMPPPRMQVLARIGAHRLLASDMQRLVRRSAALCLLTAPSEGRADIMLTGRVLQRLWLLAAEVRLTTHPVSALLDCAATIESAVAEFGATGQVAAALFRLGYATPVPRAPRLPLAELLESEGDAAAAAAERP